MKCITVPAELNELEAVQAFISAELEAADCPLKAKLQIEVAVEEIFVNIARYAYHPEAGEATIRFAVEEEPLRVMIQFLDNGRPFNPLEKEDADTTLSAEDREIGGLGILMVKKSMDAVAYSYENGYNILTIKKGL